MSKNIIEIDVVIGEPPDSVWVAKVVLVKKGDLYISHLAPDVIKAKNSYHESGVSHSYVELLGGRRTGEGEPAGQKLRGIKGYLMVNGWGVPEVLDPTGYVPAENTKVRRTLIAPKAEVGWYCYVWAIERGRHELVDKIVATNPWPEAPVAAWLLADWSDPWILVTVCNILSKWPYQVDTYSPPLPGRVPFVFIPDAFEGTWLESPTAKWRPGQPYPADWIRESKEYMGRQRALEQRRARTERD